MSYAGLSLSLPALVDDLKIASRLVGLGFHGEAARILGERPEVPAFVEAAGLLAQGETGEAIRRLDALTNAGPT